MKQQRGSRRRSMSRLSRLTQSFSRPNLNNTNEVKNTVVQKNLELDFEINEAVLNIEQLKMNDFTKKMKRVPFITVSGSSLLQSLLTFAAILVVTQNYSHWHYSNVSWLESRASTATIPARQLCWPDHWLLCRVLGRLTVRQTRFKSQALTALQRCWSQSCCSLGQLAYQFQ